MAGDYTRFTFDPLNDYAAVLMQQGRVQLDADFNEWVELLDRRLRSGDLDTLGRAVVPRETPDGFRISVSGANLEIGRGRIYVDGIQAENHGTDPQEFDARLEEERGTNPSLYDDQPYWHTPDDLPETPGPHLVYLDVWRREVTHLQDPELTEKAVGVDTTTRRQTVWQVKVLADVGSDVDCSTPDDEIPEWPEIIRPSAGRLTTSATAVPEDDDPCILPPNQGYRGTENRLYRVEIHDPGPQGTATFKWSRDNSSIATRVNTIDASRTQLGVVRTGKDSVLRFEPGDWVEITDDFRELDGEPGIMGEVLLVDETNLIITLASALPAGVFPTSGPEGSTVPDRNTRIRKWDQNGEVRDSNDNFLGNVDASGGLIQVPAAAVPEITIRLDAGIEITFSTDPAGGEFKTGDYWVFAARTADASVELLEQAPPRGIHHHYARLAMWTLPESIVNCRTLWPPDIEHGCECTVCVSAESHNSGTLTIQRAIDEVLPMGGKVCLGPGTFELGETPLSIAGARGVTLQGHGSATLLTYAGTSPALAVQRSMDVTVRRLALLTFIQSDDEAGSSVLLRNSLQVTVEDCLIAELSSLFGTADRSGEGAAVEVRGVLIRTRLQNNVLLAGSGIRTPLRTQQSLNSLALNVTPTSYFFSLGLIVQDNVLWCRRMGIALGLGSVLFGESRIAGNSVFSCNLVGIGAVGLVGLGGGATGFLGSQLDVSDNTVSVDGTGILLGTDDTRATQNDVSAFSLGQGEQTPNRHGIALTSGLDKTGMDRCQILANRILRVGGAGISIGATVNSAIIKQNVLERTGSGIVMQDAASAQGLSIDNNLLLDIASQGGLDRAVGIRLIRANQAEVTSNKIRGVGVQAIEAQNRDGIRASLCASLRIEGNEVSDIGPDDFAGVCNGIRVTDSVDRLDITDNRVRRSQANNSGSGDSNWRALSIGKFFFVGEILTTFLNLAAVTSPSANFFALNRADETEERATFLLSEVNNNIAVLIDDFVFFLPQDREIISIGGNLLEAYSRSPIVLCNTPGTVLFSNNRCLLTNLQTSNEAVVSITAASLIVNANYVQRPVLGTPDVAIGNGVQLHVTGNNENAFTVLGNLSSGGIHVNGNPLGAPWANLNVLVP